MTRTTIPVGLPVAHPTKSYWQTPKHGLANHRTTEELPGDVVDYVIIGSGITGSLIAYKLLEKEKNQDVSIVMLEARETCSGATGRNGGHCRAGRYEEFSSDLAKYGLDEALRLEKLEEDTVSSVISLIQEKEIKCDLRKVETLDLYTEPARLEIALANVKRREAIDVEIRTPKKIYEQEDLNALKIPVAKGGIGFDGWVLSPYKFICAVLEMCLSKNDTAKEKRKQLRFNLQTTTPVLDIEKQQCSFSRFGQKETTTWYVTTERGIVRARNVIIATNAYTAALYPPLADFIIPTRAQMTALRPGSKMKGSEVLMKTAQIYNAETCDYFQGRAEWFSGGGDLIVGGARQIARNAHGQFDCEQPILDDSTINSKISRHQVNSFPINFGENWGKNGETIMQWTGIMGYTRDSMPVVGKAEEGLWVCVGFNGHGMGLVERCAEAVVELIDGREEEVEDWLPRSYALKRVVGETRGRDL